MKMILVIEDNKIVRENTAEILELAGFKVFTAANGKIGVEMAVKHKPDMILCDIMMPELDGYGVVHLLSRNSQTSSIPFIFLTAKAESTDFRKGMDMGADDYITKPFDSVQLINAVELRFKKLEALKKNISDGTNDLNKFIANAASAANLKLTSEEREIISCRKKQLVYADGKYPFAVHYIVSGKIKIYKETEFGKELITGIYTEGDFIGYTTVLEDTTYSDTAEALEDAELMLIPKDDFLQLINTDTHVSKMFIKLLAKNVLEKEEKLIAMAYQSLRKKVALGIIEVLDKFKIEEGSKQEFIISRQDLSHVMGIATESLVRTLADFKVEKLIELKEGKIIILEESRLRNFQY
jgi:CRP/FNR family cyclic AMP-dependent transcriptional regulator